MTTLSAYTQVSSNLARWQTITAKTPTVATASAYYSANIGRVKSIDAFLANTRLFTFAMQAFGLGDMASAKGLMRKVLQGGISDPQALANTLNNPKILAFAKAFDFAGSGDDATTTSSATTSVVSAYVEQQLETTQGAANKGVQLALAFQRTAPKITSVYDILADKTLLTVVQTALGISPMTSAQNIDVQAANLKKQVAVADFADPKKLTNFIARFAAQYDVAQSTDTANGSSGYGLSPGVLLSLQGLRRGG